MNYQYTIISSGARVECPYQRTSQSELISPRPLVYTEDGVFVEINCGIAFINTHGVEKWTRTFAPCLRVNQAFISHDRLLVTTNTLNYHSWGILGPAFLLNGEDGSLIAELGGEAGAALGNGKFLLGLEGYGVFSTKLYAPNGEIIQEWNSYGHYVIDKNDDIRVLEKDRKLPTQSRVVRLKLDGSIIKGPRLYDPIVAPPLVLEDNSLVIIDNGVLRIVDFELNERYQRSLMEIAQRDAHLYQFKLGRNGNQIMVDIYERVQEPETHYIKHFWVLQRAPH